MTMPEDDDRDALGELAYERQIEQAMHEAELKRDRTLCEQLERMEQEKRNG